MASLVSCKNNQKSAEEFTEPVYTPAYASGFSIKGAEGKRSVIISVTNPWQGADSVAFNLLIQRNNEEIPLGFSGQVLKDKASRLVVMSSTHIAMVDALSNIDKIVGVSGIDFISNSYINKNKDKIADVGFDGNVNYEALLAANPDMVLLYGVTGASQMEAKLKELKVPYLYIGDYMEESPLGKAEWMVPIAEILGDRKMGEDVFNKLCPKYNDLKEKVGSAVMEKPLVMLNTPYGENWFMPSRNSYMIQLIEDAGGEYIYKDNDTSSSVPIDIEEAYMLTNKADVWINTGRLNTLSELEVACPKFMDANCVKAGNVFNNNLRSTAEGGNDFYESAIVNPHLVLQDLIKIFHPEMMDSVEFTYYKPL